VSSSSDRRWRVTPRFAPGNGARRVRLTFTNHALIQADEGEGGSTWLAPYEAFEDRSYLSLGVVSFVHGTAGGRRYHWWGRGGVPSQWRHGARRLRVQVGTLAIVALVAATLSVAWWASRPVPRDARVAHVAGLVFSYDELPSELVPSTRAPLAMWVNPRAAGLTSSLATAPADLAAFFERCANVTAADDVLFGPNAPTQIAQAYSGEVRSTETGLQVGVLADTMATVSDVQRDENFLAAGNHMRCFAETIAASLTHRLHSRPAGSQGWTVTGGEGAPFGMTVRGPGDANHVLTVQYAARGRDETTQLGWVSRQNAAVSSLEFERVSAVETRRLEGLSAPSPGD
jgi:hypothetical protein